MRLFYALTFDEMTIDRLIQLQDEQQGFLYKGKPTMRQNLHLTLCFLGEQMPEHLDLLHAVLRQLPNKPIELMFNKIDKFIKQDGLIIWAGIEYNQHVLDLHNMIVNQIKASSIVFTDSRFAAHVTLFRRARGTVLPQMQPFSARVKDISLMQSSSEHGVLTYTRLSSIFL